MPTPTELPQVTLHEVTTDNIDPVLRLRVAEGQRGFVADNATSLAEAYVYPNARPRAIYAGEAAVGFVMLAVDPADPEVFLWRLMIDTGEQGKGYGWAAMQLILAHVRTLPHAKTFATSYVPGDGCPEPFYRKLGFAPTGEVDDGELVLRMTL